jgi:hypothetical protein
MGLSRQNWRRAGRLLAAGNVIGAVRTEEPFSDGGLFAFLPSATIRPQCP